jgi:hypothetical protein
MTITTGVNKKTNMFLRPGPRPEVETTHQTADFFAHDLPS